MILLGVQAKESLQCAVFGGSSVKMKSKLKRRTLSKVNSIRFARKWWLLLLPLGIVILVLFYPASPQSVGAAKAPNPQTLSSSSIQAQSSPSATNRVFLPFIRALQGPAQPALLGAYGPSGNFWGDQTNINNYLIGLDAWAGLSRGANKGHALAGDFKAIEDPNPSYNISRSLELLWSNGYVAFMNMSSNNSAATIAGGSLDPKIQAWANTYKAWVSLGESRKAFIAPLQEMNGSWTPYGCDPDNFRLAYQRIQTIFANAGVTPSQIWWVFAPNGWSSPCYPMWRYYPGDANVDIVAFSSYNQSCLTAWMTPSQVFGPFITDIRTNVTSNKPIFIAQTATSSVGGDKDQWIRDAYSYLLQQEIRAILYVNGDLECDWAVYRPPSGPNVQGYKDAVNSPYFRYYTPAALSGLTFLP